MLADLSVSLWEDEQLAWLDHVCSRALLKHSAKLVGESAKISIHGGLGA